MGKLLQLLQSIYVRYKVYMSGRRQVDEKVHHNIIITIPECTQWVQYYELRRTWSALLWYRYRYRTDGVYMQCFLMVSQNDNRTPVLGPRPRTIPGLGTPPAGGGNPRRNVRRRPSNVSTVDSDDESNRAYFSPTHASPTGALALRNI
jgi:hypothetical protein